MELLYDKNVITLFALNFSCNQLLPLKLAIIWKYVFFMLLTQNNTYVSFSEISKYSGWKQLNISFMNNIELNIGILVDNILYSSFGNLSHLGFIGISNSISCKILLRITVKCSFCFSTWCVLWCSTTTNWKPFFRERNTVTHRSKYRF